MVANKAADTNNDNCQAHYRTKKLILIFATGGPETNEISSVPNGPSNGDARHHGGDGPEKCIFRNNHAGTGSISIRLRSWAKIKPITAKQSQA